MFAELIIRNARSIDLTTDQRLGIAVKDGVILWIGPTEQHDGFTGPQTQVVDAGGATLLPGFVESHAHLFTGGAALQQLNLGAVQSTAALAQALLAFSGDVAADDLICCYGAQYTMLGEDRRPTRHELDAICPDRPLYISATDFHCGWANTAALIRAGILHGADAGPGSEVMMGADGLATGELREFGAMALVKRTALSGGRADLGLTGDEPIGKLDDAARRQDQAMLALAMEHSARHGITSVVNMDGNLYLSDLLSEMASQNALPVRVSLPMTLTDSQSPERLKELMDRAGQTPVGLLQHGGIKMFMDGVFDTWTALLVDDYPERPGSKGDALFGAASFDAICCEADRRGLQIAVHAVGDGAVRRVLDGYHAAYLANGHRDARHRIEHIDTIHPDDLPRLLELDVLASMQPVHPPGSAGLPLEPTTTIMGRQRWPYAFAWRMIADLGVPIAFGTDWPVSPIDPLYAIHCALTRQPWTNDMPDQRLDLAECLRSYTKAGAFGMFADEMRGELRVGMQADLVLVRGDLQSLATQTPEVAVTMTICGGRITYQAKRNNGAEFA